jgi:hypothetical protein
MKTRITKLASLTIALTLLSATSAHAVPYYVHVNGVKAPTLNVPFTAVKGSTSYWYTDYGVPVICPPMVGQIKRGADVSAGQSIGKLLGMSSCTASALSYPVDVYFNHGDGWNLEVASTPIAPNFPVSLHVEDMTMLVDGGPSCRFIATPTIGPTEPAFMMFPIIPGFIPSHAQLHFDASNSKFEMEIQPLDSLAMPTTSTCAGEFWEGDVITNYDRSFDITTTGSNAGPITYN